MALSMSLLATPGSAICRTMTSRRGSSTVALRWAMPSDLRNCEYSEPHSAAGRVAKFSTLSRPSTRMREGRTRAATISRSAAPISMPTPEPNASSLRRSWEIGISKGMPGLIAPAGAAESSVVPPQDVDRRIVAVRHVFHLRRHRPLEVRKLTVGKQHARGGANVDNRVARHAQEGGARSQKGRHLRKLLIVQRARAAAFDDEVDGVRGQADRRQNGCVRRVSIYSALRTKGRQAVHQAAHVNQPPPPGTARCPVRRGSRDIGSVKDLGSNAFH